MPTAPKKAYLGSALGLIALILFCIGMLSALAVMLAPQEMRQREQTQQLRLAKLLQGLNFNNQPLEDQVVLPLAASEALGFSKPRAVHMVRLDERVVAWMIPVRARGYQDDIDLWVLVKATGAIHTVSVQSHRETDGIGAVIDGDQSGWIARFNGQSLTNTHPDDWRVEPEGGRVPTQVDGYSGATWSCRAVTHQVHRALQVLSEHRQVLSAKTQTQAAP